MGRRLLAVALLAGLLALSACAAQEKEALPVEGPAPAAPAAPAAILPGKDAWQEEWERVLEAAKREGKVAMLGPQEADIRRALTEPFEKKYGIKVEFLGDRAAAIAARIQTERTAGQYLWDVLVHGVTTPLVVMKPRGTFDPIEPALILPEVKEPKNWRQGKLSFADRDRYILVMTPFQRGLLFVNPNMVDPKQFKSYRDLLDPRWKGKLLADDPRIGGPGRATFTFFYKHPELGPDFIRALAKQELVMLRDYVQETEWLGQGKYPILVGSSDATVEPLMKQGVPIAIVPPTQMKEGSDVSPANGTVILFNRAPHPNAAKVYINWLLSKEAQTEFVRAAGYVSARLDVPTDHALPWRVPRPGAIDSYTEETQELVTKTVLPFLSELFGR